MGDQFSAWFPYNRPDRPDRRKIGPGDWDDHDRLDRQQFYPGDWDDRQTFARDQ